MPESRRTRSHAGVAAAVARHRPAQAMARYAPELAVALYEQAVRALDRLDPPGAAGATATMRHDAERVHMLSRLSLARLATGAGQAALQTRAAAIGAAERSGDDALLVLALTAWDLPTPWAVEPYGTWDRHLTSLLERDVTGDMADATRCRLLYALVREVAGRDQGRAHDAGRQAEQLAEAFDDPLLLGLALHARGVALLHDGDMAERLPLDDELVEIGHGRGLAVFALIGHEFVVQAAATRGDVATLADRVEQLAALVRTYRWQQSDGIIEMHRGLLAHIGDDLVAAARHYGAGADILRRNGGLDVERIAGIAAFSLAVTADRVADLLPLLESFRPPPPEALDMFAVMLAAAGRTQEARRMQRAAPPIRADFFRPLFLTVRGVAAVTLGDVAGAREVSPALIPYANQLGGAATGIFALGPVDTVLGDLAVLLADRGAAAVHCRRAAAFARKCGSASWVATARRHLDRL